ncbi:MAG TPA: tRNA lysidine(34) synthetase TilS [Caulobacteraceae bacterium]
MRGGLTARAPSPPDAAFDRWLTGPAAVPVAVALSGGGDSLALLHLARAWADRAGRRLVALTVDHGLQAPSAAWARFAGERARRLGVAHRSLAWTGGKPAGGLPAAARAARHALLADAARAEGAAVILMGHTADDLAEAELMRAAGSTAPSPRAWSPSPAWPEGRGVFLLRPLLGLRRSELREQLRALGETWIDDPANDDPRYARAAARRRLAAGAATQPPAIEAAAAPACGLATVRAGLAGELTAPRAALAAERGGLRLLGALALCAAGTARPPSAASLARLAERAARGEDFTASLAGARIEVRGPAVLACREAGERVRRGLAAAPLPRGESVFDGRFLVTAEIEGLRIGFLAGHAARLPVDVRRRLAAVPAAARGALPALTTADGEVSCPSLCDTPTATARPLAWQRLNATLGAFRDEAALWRVAKSDAGA